MGGGGELLWLLLFGSFSENDVLLHSRSIFRVGITSNDFTQEIVQKQFFRFHKTETFHIFFFCWLIGQFKKGRYAYYCNSSSSKFEYFTTEKGREQIIKH